MRGSLCCDRGVAGALCSFGIVVAARGWLVGGYAVARTRLAGYALVVYGCVVVVLSPALRVAGFVAVASCAPPDGRFVLLSAVLGRLRSVAVVWWCMAPLRVERDVVVCGPLHDGAWCGVPCPPAWLGMQWWCVALLMVERGVVARGTVVVGRGVLVCGTSHGGACCVGVWPPSCLGGSGCMVKNEEKGRKMTGLQRHQKIVVLMDTLELSQTSMGE